MLTNVLTLEQDEPSDVVSNPDDAQESWLSISDMLEKNATTLKNNNKGKEILLFLRDTLDKPRQPPNFLFPPMHATQWKSDEKNCATWKSYHTVSLQHFPVLFKSLLTTCFSHEDVQIGAAHTTWKDMVSHKISMNYWIAL